MSKSTFTVNDYTKKYAGQRWLAAHNAWNTEIGANQRKKIAELLDYGVRGFALDIYGDDKDDLHLQHGTGNIGSWTDWSKVLNEITTWMNKEENKREIVSLFFESYLTGPKPGDVIDPEDPKTALEALDYTLRKAAVCNGKTYYVSGKTAAKNALRDNTLADLADGKTNADGTKTDPQRLFAFIEKQPDEGKQRLFRVMPECITENDFGDAAIRPKAWVDRRPGSTLTGVYRFMNHFGSNPKWGDRWERNDPDFIVKHAHIFALNNNGHYPNFTSLDDIDWDAKHGPMFAMDRMRPLKDFRVTDFNWDGDYSYDDHGYDLGGVPVSRLVPTFSADGKYIVSISAEYTPNILPIVAVKVAYAEGKGIVDFCYQHKGQNMGLWQRNQGPLIYPVSKLHTYSGKSLIGIGWRIKEGRVIDFAGAFERS